MEGRGILPTKGECAMNINKGDVSTYTITGEFDIQATVSPDAESKAVKTSKTVWLRYILENTPLSEVISSALKDKRIVWQSGARGKFDSITNGSIIKVAFKGGQLPIDPKEAMVARLRAMTPEAREKELAAMMAEASK